VTAPLFNMPKKLTDRQQAAYIYVAGDGKTALEVGLMLHATRTPKCSWCVLAGDTGCDWAATDGRHAMYELRRKGLVVRRRATGQWQHTGTPARTDTGAQGDLPAGY
jgi:hypothetical protein